ncbi:DUF7527 domain-containing protein [Halosolutus gelatinilyticus]|uniref:DUF7527 domain-containing protein n=1 Tax=Halosolutus gelatinilyticus TaxID=2931975 RepID=UPI001FF14C09|nr:transcriptional regulator [Halosolutus gelatinilyticus]
MDSRTQERVERWDSRPFNGGYDGLSDLADSGFSGAVTAAGTWLFMLNGRVVGVVDGDIEDFENASGTRYEASDPSLPLLCSMEERGGETRAKYYTNETPLREVDDTLQSGSFTGYLVLSENVLSGDYYVVYYGGRRMAAAYIGNAERLLTGDEAFERAADEVGIYEVIDVDVDVTDVPGAEVDPASGNASSTAVEPTSESSSTAADSGRSPGESGSTDESAASAIESIDLSGDGAPIEDAADGSDDDSLATGGIDLTDDPTGITTTADADPEPASAGITDTEIDLGPAANGPDDGTASSTESDSTAGISSDLPIEDAESGQSTAPDGSADDVDGSGTDAPASTDEGVSVDFSAADVESEPTDASAGEAVSEPDRSESADGESATEPAPNPDLEEIEAAAEELDRNDISWVDDDDSSESTATESTDDGGSSAATESSSAGSDLDERFEEEEQWRETRSIPSIDPDNSETPTSSRTRSSQARSTASADQSASGTGSSGSTNRSSADARDSADGRREGRAGSRSPSRSQSRSRSRADSGSDGATQERVQKLTDRLETLEEQRDALQAKAEEREAERDELHSKNQQLASTVERLQSRIDDLETELERAREEAADAAASAAADEAGSTAATELPPQRALSQTNLFVRYDSKSQPTLEKAHDGAADRSEVAANLRLEHHTQFDAADVAVDGRPFEEFLASTMAYRFVNWLTERVLYEIRDTGNADGLADLYDAIPRIDRAELNASVSLEDDDTAEVPDRVEFDAIAYDKMGNPLVVANLNESRTPATKGMLEEMEEHASAVKANYPDLAASVVVTSSYFEPGALEIAEQATSGGFLSRGSRLSYVNLSRKAGYHLCLVESRSEGFHMNVPEL